MSTISSVAVVEVVEVEAIVPSSSSATPIATTSKLTSSSALKTIKEQKRNKRCILCNRWTVNELTLGPLYSRDGVICHYFCLLFCCNLRQNGEEDTDGILGFLTDDIKKEVRRVKGSKTSKNYNFYKCRFCNEPGATLGCFVKKCRMVYHFPCGLKNGVRFKFNSNFGSYCDAHAGPKIFKPVILHDCVICSESLDESDCTKPVVLGRCCSNSNMHQKCVQIYALSAGSHHLKCPTCADKELFIPDVKSQGVFVPEKDADWETDSRHAFDDLRQRYSRCDAPNCLYPKGRDRHDKDKGSIWHLLRCNSCAASAVHVNCENSANLDKDYNPPKWFCCVCREVEERSQLSGETAILPVAEVSVGDATAMDVGEEIQVDFGGEIQADVGGEIQVTVGGENETPKNDVVSPPRGSEIDAPTVPAAIPQMDEEGSDDNESISSGGTLFSVVRKQLSNHKSPEPMRSSPPLSGVTALDVPPNAAIANLQYIKNEVEEGTCNPVLSFSDNDIDRGNFSGNGGSSCGSDSDSDVSLFIPVEPPRKKRKNNVNQVTLPAFKISSLKSEDEDVKEIRCYCDRYTDEEQLVQCLRCSVWFHKRCRAGLYEIYGKSLKTRCCKTCTSLPALKELQEIPLSGRYVPRGCENTKKKTYYLTLVKRGGGEKFMVRRHDALYISEKGNRNLESSRILRVEKLWKNNKEEQFISGHFYFLPSETANADTRRFYRKEIFRASTPATTAIKMEDVLGRCWILDPVTYCKGRPTGLTVDDEKDVFICESWVDVQTRRISMMELAYSMHSICMKPDAFKEFKSEMKIKKDYWVKGSARGNQGSSSGSSPARVVGNTIVVLDSDSD